MADKAAATTTTTTGAPNEMVEMKKKQENTSSDETIEKGEDDEGPLAVAVKTILSVDSQALKAYARKLHLASKEKPTAKDELTVLENQLFDLARAVREGDEPLFDLPMGLLTTRICSFLPTRQDWNNFLQIKKTLKNFADASPPSMCSPPWPVFPRPESYGGSFPGQQYQYVLSPDGQFIAFTKTPGGMVSSVIYVFSRKYGLFAGLVSAGPFPFRCIHFKQEIVQLTDGGDGKTTEDVVTYVQAIDSGGIYLEWKLFQSPQDPNFSLNGTPKVKEFHDPRGDYGNWDYIFSEDGSYLVADATDSEDGVYIQNVNKGGKDILHYETKNSVRAMKLSGDKRWLALARDDGVMEVCELLVGGTADDDLRVGRVLYLKPPVDPRDMIYPLAFSPDNTKLVTTNAENVDGEMIIIWDLIWDLTKSTKSSLFQVKTIIIRNRTEGIDSCVQSSDFSANGKHLIVKVVTGKFDSDDDASDDAEEQQRKDTLEVWCIETGKLVTSLPTTSLLLEAINHSSALAGDRTFILLEEREEVTVVSEEREEQSNRHNGNRNKKMELKKTVNVVEVDDNGHIVSYGNKNTNKATVVQPAAAAAGDQAETKKKRKQPPL